MLSASVRLSASATMSRPLTMVDFVAVAASRPKMSATLVTIAAVPPKLRFAIFNRSLHPLDADFHFQCLGAAAVERAGGRRRVAVVPPHGDADVVGLGDDAVGRVEAAPADLGEVDLRPGVARVALRTGRVGGPGVEVSADVSRRN